MQCGISKHKVSITQCRFSLFVSRGKVRVATQVNKNKKNDIPNNFNPVDNDFFNFLVTMVATFIGVFLAIYFTNLDEIQKEKRNVIKLLDGISIDMDSHVKSTSALRMLIHSDTSSVFSMRDHIKNNPARIPKLFSEMSNNEMILRHFTEPGIQAYSFCLGSLTKMEYSINELIALDNEILKNTLRMYQEQLDYGRKLISIERANLNGELSEKEIEEYYESYYNQLIEGANGSIEEAIIEQNQRTEERKKPAANN